MNYDPKKRQIWAVKNSDDEPFKGPLRLSITDNSNNEKLYETRIK